MATLPRVLEMGQLGTLKVPSRPIKDVLSSGLPSDDGLPDCPDLILQYRSRHWTTSFRLLPMTGEWHRFGVCQINLRRMCCHALHNQAKWHQRD